MSKSLLDYAYDYVSGQKNESTFAKMWAYVKKEAGLSNEEAEKKVGQFYTNLLLDGRFVAVGGNKWNLRSRLKFDEVHISMDEYYSDSENSTNDDAEESAESDDYDNSFKEETEDVKGEPEESEHNSENASETKNY